LRQPAADAAQPAVADAAAQAVDGRERRRWRDARRRVVEQPGLGARELVVGQHAALVQVAEAADFFAEAHGSLRVQS